MVYLFTKEDIAEYRQVSSSVPDKVINPYIMDAQFNDLQKLLGSEFYNDLVRNSTDPEYVKLLDGGTYTYKGTEYTNVGLKMVGIHYAYGRYILLGSNIDTPFGLVTKDSDSSTPSDLPSKKTIKKENDNLAFNYWENVLLFISRNIDDYPLFTNSCLRRKNTFRISKIGR